MNIFGKRVRGPGARKSLFLCSTILRGRMAKDENDGAGGGANDIEVGPGFEEAARRMGSDDNRQPTNQGGGATQEIPDEGSGDNGDEGGEEGQGGDDQGGEGEEGNEAPKPKKKRETAQYIRDVKRELREERARNAAMEARLAALENGGSTNRPAADIPDDTSGRPNPEDAKKYPLGVLDDGYIEDLSEWKAGKVVRQALDGERTRQQQSAAQASEETRMAELKTKMDNLTDQGEDQFDDFEETVIETGMRGDWKLTETTFTACAEADNGAAILHALANDKTEALRVSKLTPFQQMKYVAEKDGEIEAKKPKPRKKPGAIPPPSNDAPRGRNGSAPIRADTDNLDDFRKLYYK